MFLTLASIVLALSAFDLGFTCAVMGIYGGVAGERNPIIRFLVPKVGIFAGVALGIGIPTAAWLALGAIMPALLIPALLAKGDEFVRQIKFLLGPRSTRISPCPRAPLPDGFSIREQ